MNPFPGIDNQLSFFYYFHEKGLILKPRVGILTRQVFFKDCSWTMILSWSHLKRGPLVTLSKVWSFVSVWLNFTLGLVLDKASLQLFWIKIFAKCVDSKSLMNSPGKNLNELRALGFWGREAKKQTALKFTGSPFEKVLFRLNFMKRPYCRVFFSYIKVEIKYNQEMVYIVGGKKREMPQSALIHFCIHDRVYFLWKSSFHTLPNFM